MPSATPPSASWHELTHLFMGKEKMRTGSTFQVRMGEVLWTANYCRPNKKVEATKPLAPLNKSCERGALPGKYIRKLFSNLPQIITIPLLFIRPLDVVPFSSLCTIVLHPKVL